MNARSRRLRFFSLALAVLGLCMVLLCGCRPAEEKADSSPAELPVIVVGSDNYPPFNYTGSDGQPTGVDVELAQEAFRRLGYRVQFVTINWEEKKTLVENGTIDCAWGSFSMNGREDEYTWAGPYLHSRQVVAVRTSSDIYTLADLADKTLVVQSTTKPEELFLDAAANGLPQLRQTVRRCIKEQLLRLCGGLHHQRLVRKVGQGIDVAAGAHGHHLTAVQIGPGPGVFVLTPVHGKAAPGTVNGAVLHQGLLLLPVDGHELHPITQAAECLLGQLHIHAGGLTVRAGVIERRVVVAAHHDDRQLCRAAVRFFFGRAAAAQQHHAQAQHRQRQAEKP